MATDYPKTSTNSTKNIIAFERKDEQPYIHNIPAFLKQNARARDDNTVTISDPNSDAGLCVRCGEPAPIEYAYKVPFKDDPELSMKVVTAYCATHWLEHVEKEFLPRIQDREEI